MIKLDILVNKKKVGLNSGGSTPFSFYITDVLFEKGNNDLKKIMVENNFSEGANNHPGEFVLEKAFVG